MSRVSFSVPAGWHPDPADPAQQRWWDGKGWTEHTRPVAPSDGAGAVAPTADAAGRSGQSVVPGAVSPMPGAPAAYPQPSPVPPWASGPQTAPPWGDQPSGQPGRVDGQPVGQPGPGPQGGQQSPFGQQPGQGPELNPYAHYGQGPLGPDARRNTSFGRWWSALRYRNQASVTTIVLAAVYVVLALRLHFVLIGFLPAMYAYQAFRRKEPLAPVALLAALIPFILLLTLSRI